MLIKSQSEVRLHFHPLLSIFRGSGSETSDTGTKKIIIMTFTDDRSVMHIHNVSTSVKRTIIAPRSRNSPSLQLPGGQELQQMQSEISQTTASENPEKSAPTQRYIEQLKSRVAELERRLYGSRAEVHQVMAEMKQLQLTINQRDQQVARLENEKRAVQFQVGCSNSVAKPTVVDSFISLQ